MNGFDILTGTVLGIQTIGPLALGVPQFWHPDTFAKEKDKDANKQKRVEDRTEARRARLTPILCPACHAPVPLLAEVFPCPFCKAEVRPPPEYVEVFAVRNKVYAELQQAEELWRRSRWITSRVLTGFLRWSIVPWLLLVLFSSAWAATNWESGFWIAVGCLASILAIAQLFILFPVASVFDDMRNSMPLVPKAHFLRAPEDHAPCRHCHAPVTFEEDALASICGYCGGENFRLALAEQSRKQAMGQESVASYSLVEVMDAYRERKAGLRFAAAFMAIAELFYSGVAVAIGLGEIWDWLGW